MPTLISDMKEPRSLRGKSPLLNTSSSTFDPLLAGRAIVEGLQYLKNRLEISWLDYHLHIQ